MSDSDRLASTNISTARPKRLFVVEDESLIALLLSEQLVALGHSVVGPACTMSEALHLASVAQFDAALLDLNMHGVFVGPVAEKLAQRQILFIFITGYDRPPPGFFENVSLLNKPYTLDDLRRAVEDLLAKLPASDDFDAVG
jgi:CheY-like chemotaxis protein